MASHPPSWSFDIEYNTYESGCGDLVLALREFFRDLSPGTRVLVLAGDPGSAMEIPAWCRLTGHSLLEAAPPSFLIQKRTS